MDRTSLRFVTTEDGEQPRGFAAPSPGAPTAETLNEHLAAGGRVQVTTYGRSTIYQKRHAGMFSQGKDGNLYVASGRSKDCLTMAGGTKVLVGIRLIK